MKKILAVTLLLGACSASEDQAPVGQDATDTPEVRKSEWVTIFNGEDLGGWIPKVVGSPAGENPGNLFRVEDGMLRVSYDQYDRFEGQFGHIFYDKELSHYRLKLEYRFTGEQLEGGPGWAWRNSGAMLHGQHPATMGVDQEFPVSIESQFLGGRAEGKRPTGNVCSPGTHVVIDGALVTDHCINSSSETFPGDQWVTFEAEVRGDQVIRHYINGELVFELTAPQYDATDSETSPVDLMKSGDLKLGKGYISLQAESHGVDFRNIQVMELTEQ